MLAPASFEQLMMKVLGDQNMQSLIIFMDDVLLYASDADEMIDRVDVVLSKLESVNLKLKPNKCHLLKKQVTYLGHLISAEGIQMDPEKTAAIHNYPVPQTVSALKIFLGLASFYRQFVHKFAEKTSPLLNRSPEGCGEQISQHENLLDHRCK